MKYSVFLPTGFGREFARIPDPVQAYETLTEIAVTAEETGYHALWAPDHLTTIPPSQEIVFEAWSVITGLAPTPPGSDSASSRPATVTATPPW
jgi:alkanesulfonate monooxygenase SsuD/methylene tetrahydromethanopterin reductase-like flavin-dependent oxidoreductase (luciferase family)